MITDREHVTPPRTTEGVLLLSARNVRNGYLDLEEEVDYVSEDTYSKIIKRLELLPGDVLLSCSGSVGRSCVVPPNIKFTLVRSVAVLKPILVSSEYISYALRSLFLQRQIDQKKTQTAQPNIFQGKIKTLVFPLPPLEEQHRIVAEVEQRLSVAREVESSAEVALVRASRLRQAVLRSALEGRLT